MKLINAHTMEITLHDIIMADAAFPLPVEMDHCASSAIFRHTNQKSVFFFKLIFFEIGIESLELKVLELRNAVLE